MSNFAWLTQHVLNVHIKLTQLRVIKLHESRLTVNFSIANEDFVKEVRAVPREMHTLASSESN